MYLESVECNSKIAFQRFHQFFKETVKRKTKKKILGVIFLGEVKIRMRIIERENGGIEEVRGEEVEIVLFESTLIFLADRHSVKGLAGYQGGQATWECIFT